MLHNHCNACETHIFAIRIRNLTITYPMLANMKKTYNPRDWYGIHLVWRGGGGWSQRREWWTNEEKGGGLKER